MMPFSHVSCTRLHITGHKASAKAQQSVIQYASGNCSSSCKTSGDKYYQSAALARAFVDLQTSTGSGERLP
jgi:hypothetical protein